MGHDRAEHERYRLTEIAMRAGIGKAAGNVKMQCACSVL